MQYLIPANFIRTAAALSLLALALPICAQQRGDTPLGGLGAERETRYPSGDRHQVGYETFPGGLELKGFSPKMSASSVTDLVRAQIERRLPEGFSLRTGHTSRAFAGVRRLELPSTPASSEKLISLYPLEFQTVPLARGSDYMTIISGDGRLLVTRERGIPTEVDGTRADVRERSAVSAARDHALSDLGIDSIEALDAELEIWVDQNRKGRLAWRVVLDASDQPEPVGRMYWIGALGRPDVLHWETTIYHTHFGTASGNLWPTTPLRGTHNDVMAVINVDRSSPAGTVQTAPNGRYGFTNGSGNADIEATLQGPHVNIINMAGDVMQVSRGGTEDQALDLNFGATGELEFSQISAFYWTNFARRLGDAGLAVDPDHQMPTHVNRDANCNAFYRLSDKSTTYFTAGGACPNTAYSDVVLHEYGHYIDHVNGGILDGGLSEGMGDALAILGTRQACLGRDFLGAGTCLRPATDILTWPPAPGEGVHARGRRYAGFVWELVQQLAQRFGTDAAYDIATELVVATFAASPSSIPDAVHIAFLLDDTDGDLSNGTPRFSELAAAADSRNLPRPADPPGTATGPGTFIESVDIGSRRNIPTSITNVGTINMTCPANGRVKLQLSGAAVFFAEGTVLRYGFGTSASNTNIYSLLIGNLDGDRGIRWRQPVSAMYVVPCSAGPVTYHANVEKTSVFNAGNINLGNLSFSATFYPSS